MVMVNFDKYREDFKNKLGNIDGWEAQYEEENVGVDDYVTVLEFYHDNKDMSIVCNVHSETEELEFILQGGKDNKQKFFYTVRETHDAMKENQ